MSFIIRYPDTTRSASTAPSHQHPLDGTQNHRDGRPLSLTGLVGRDGQVYWLEETAAKLFDTETLVIHHVNPPLPHVYDVAGFIPIQLHRLHDNNNKQPPQKYHREHNKQHYFRSWFLRHRVLTHAQLCQAFQNHAKTTPASSSSGSSRTRTQDDDEGVGDRIRHFGALLNDRDTYVVEGTDPINKIPALCIVIPNNRSEKKPVIPTTSNSSLADFKRFLMDAQQQPIPFFIWLACFKLRIQKDLYQLPSPPFNFLKKKSPSHQCRRSLSEKKEIRQSHPYRRSQKVNNNININNNLE